MTVYQIHDNGGCPLRAEVEDGRVTVIVNASGETACEFIPDEIFIGRSPRNAMTEWSGAHGREYDGNTILLRVEDKYVFIGWEVYEFTPRAKIVDYVSPVGNYDVPYPYAYDADGNIYLIVEHIVLLNRGNVRAEIREARDPYNYYYTYCNIKNKPTRKGMNELFLRVNGRLLSFIWIPDPGAQYDCWHRDGDEIYLLSKNTPRKLSREDYIHEVNSHPNAPDFIERVHVRTIYAREI